MFAGTREVYSERTSPLYFEDGYCAPAPLLDRSECAQILALSRSEASQPMDWIKGWAASCQAVFELASRPRMLDLLKPVLGQNIILWGASVVERDPGQTHPWHVDIESSASEGCFASLWIGLENTGAGSSLHLMSRSHRFGKSIQELQRERGFRRGEASDERVLSWAREFDSDSTHVQPRTADGEGVLFDGRIWHSSNNVSATRRAALLLQYASAEWPIYMPDFSQVEWPFRFHSTRPPCILISGVAGDGINRLVPPPARSDTL